MPFRYFRTIFLSLNIFLITAHVFNSIKFLTKTILYLCGVHRCNPNQAYLPFKHTAVQNEVYIMSKAKNVNK